MPWIRSRRIQRETVAVLIAMVTILTPFAFASPPDQTWIPGLYDNGDHDDVILLVTDARGTPVAPRANRPVPLGLAADDRKPDAETHIGSPSVSLAFEGRAPPIA